MLRRNLLAGVCLLAACASFPVRADDDWDDGREGGRFVYTMTNAGDANGIMVYRQAGDGSLSPSGPVGTGGKGTGGGLGSQGALVVSSSGRWLLAVNAGSDDVSVFRIRENGVMALASRTPSGGSRPISVTISGRTVYVLNAGTPNNISGFRLQQDGSLTPIAGSTRALSVANAGPAQVAFSPDGEQLIVTEKATNMIDVFPVESGVAGAIVSNVSNGATPFGFDFGKRGRLFVSEAFGGAPGASAASSYNVMDDGMIQVISGSVGTTQTAACWLVIDPTGRYAYTTNTGSRTVSVYRVGRDGSLTLRSSTAMTPAGGPIDAAFSRGGRFLNILTAGGATVVTFRVKQDGELQEVGTVMAPVSAVGLAAQ